VEDKSEVMEETVLKRSGSYREDWHYPFFGVPNRSLNRNRDAVLAQRLLGCSQHPDDSQPVMSITARLLALTDTLQKVLALQAQGFIDL